MGKIGALRRHFGTPSAEAWTVGKPARYDDDSNDIIYYLIYSIMAKGKKGKMGKRSYRKRYAMSNPSGKTMIMRSTQPFPDRYIAQLKANVTVYDSQVSGGSVSDIGSIKLNSVFRPFNGLVAGGSTSNQSLYGLKQLAKLYSKCRVYQTEVHAKFNTLFRGGAAGTPEILSAVLLPYPGQGLDIPDTVEDWARQPQAKRLTLLPFKTTGTKFSINCSKLDGRLPSAYKADEETVCKFNIGTQTYDNPTNMQLCYLRMSALDDSTDNNLDWLLDITIVQHIEFFDRWSADDLDITPIDNQ